MTALPAQRFGERIGFREKGNVVRPRHAPGFSPSYFWSWLIIASFQGDASRSALAYEVGSSCVLFGCHAASHNHYDIGHCPGRGAVAVHPTACFCHRRHFPLQVLGHDRD